MSNAKREMSFRHQWVLAVGADGSLSAPARLMAVMAVMEFGTPNEGEPFWPSHAKLANLVGKSERTARRQIAEVASSGWIEVQHRDGTSNMYLPKMKTPAIRDRGTPDIPDQGRWSEVSAEQTQEHSHQQIQASAGTEATPGRNADEVKYPCFDCGLTECTCSTEETVVVCMDHGGGVYLLVDCPHCARHAQLAVSEAKIPEFKRRDWYENENESEGLATDGDGPSAASKTFHYKGRGR